VPFHIFQWSINARIACEFARRNGYDAAQAARFDELLDELEPHIARDENGTWVLYPYAYKFRNVQLTPGWHSGIGQAFLLSTLVMMFEVSGDDRFLNEARSVFRTYTHLRAHAEAGQRWFTFRDSEGYLWFEEYPTERPEQLRVLNGHLHARQGIYSFHRLAPSRASELLLQAGITTMERYIHEFRRPGATNWYCLSLRGPNGVIDYGPQRAKQQQRWLYEITQDPFFYAAWRTFSQDMPAGV